MKKYFPGNLSPLICPRPQLASLLPSSSLLHSVCLNILLQHMVTISTRNKYINQSKSTWMIWNIILFSLFPMIMVSTFSKKHFLEHFISIMPPSSKYLIRMAQHWVHWGKTKTYLTKILQSTRPNKKCIQITLWQGRKLWVVQIKGREVWGRWWNEEKEREDVHWENGQEQANSS